MTTAVEKVIPARNIPRGQSPMELLTPRELSQTTEVRTPTTTGRVTIPDPSDTLGDPVVEQRVRKLIKTAGRLFANRNDACLQAGTDEIEPSDSKFCSRCHKDANWSETIRQRTALNRRRRLDDSSWHKL